MNIILLSSQYGYFNASTVKPLGCYQLASWLRQHGYTVKVIDHCSVIHPDALLSIISKYCDATTVAIGVSSTFWSEGEKFTATDQRTTYQEPEWVVNIRQLVEANMPHLEWLLGGPSASFPAHLRLAWKTFTGHGEDTLLAYLDKKLGRDIERKPFDIASSTMQYHETDFIQPHESLSMELGRGCQFKCKFCQLPYIGKAKGTYLRSMDCIRNDLIYNYERFGVTRYNFIDDTVNEDYDKVVALAKMAQTLPFELEWVGYNRIDLIWSKPETIQILRDSGLRSSFFGIETFNAQASKFIGKGWFGKYAKDFVLELREKWKGEVSFLMTFIAGLDDESEQEVLDTADWLLSNQFYSWFYNPLQIKRIRQGTETLYKSEFELNYADYGYRFPNPLNDQYWESSKWNAHYAIEVATECNRRLDQSRLRVPAGFNVFEMTNLGFDTKEVLTKHLKDYDFNDLLKRRRDFYLGYTQRSLDAVHQQTWESC